MLHYQRQGSGPEVVLVHGFLASGKIFEPLANHLLDRFTVTTIDLPGFAGSYDIASPSTVEQLSEMIVETIKSIGVKKCSILGHSLGAWIALEISIRHPDMLDKTVLYGGSADGEYPNRFESYEQSIEKIHSKGLIKFSADVAAEWFHKGREDPMYPFTIEAGRKSNKEASINHIQSWSKWKTSDRLNKVKTPTLIVCGEHDRSTHPDLSIYLWKNIKSSSLFIIPNAGHIAHLEYPDEFNSIIGKYLRQS
jgi:3-oxoadipate enol-lactonase